MVDITHAMNVSCMAGKVGVHMGLAEQECMILSVGGLFHDVGKISIPKSLLNKPGTLTQDERSVIELHTQLGCRLLKNIPDKIHQEISRIALDHHERLDGSGYYRKPAAQQPIMVRIVAACDVMDALLTDRPYRRAWTRHRAQAHMQEHAGALFDIDVVNALLAIMKPHIRA